VFDSIELSIRINFENVRFVGAYCKMSLTVGKIVLLSYPGVESGRGVTVTAHPLLVPRSKNRVQL
jgi:hypothetical protein